jgi:aminoglycoside phosphotransferase (APT) family kinase protein
VAVPSERDDDEARRRLSAWLAAQVGTRTVELGPLDRPGLSGYSNETILLDAAWDDGSGRQERSLVIRVEPTGHTVFPDTAFEEQARVMRALRAEGSVPVPEVLWFEEDPEVLGARFLVMGRVPGRVPPDNPSYHTEGWFSALAPATQQRTWWSGLDAMAAVHAVDRGAVGLDWVEPRTSRQLAADTRDYIAFATDGAGFRLLEEVLDELEATVPPEVEPALCWGDARIGNIIFEADGTVAAVLDWEMVTAGDPVQDLAWFLVIDRSHHEAFGVPRLAALPDREATAARWAQRTGRSAEHLAWFEMLGAVRYGAIVARVLHLLDRNGILPGAIEMAFDNPGSQLVERLLAERS